MKKDDILKNWKNRTNQQANETGSHQHHSAEHLEQLLEPTRRENNFISSVKKSLIKNSSHKFKIAYETYEEYLMKDDLLSQNDRIIKISKAISKSLFEFIYTNAFNENDISNYIEVIESKVSPKIFSFMLWTQDKKDACFFIFENYEFNFTEKEYDSLFVVFAPSASNPNLPMSIEKRKEYLLKQKNEFLFHQGKYKLLQELSELPKKDGQEQSKKPKI